MGNIYLGNQNYNFNNPNNNINYNPYNNNNNYGYNNNYYNNYNRYYPYNIQQQNQFNQPPINYINQNPYNPNNNNIKEEGYNSNESIYFFNTKDTIINNASFFDYSQSIYSLSQFKINMPDPNNKSNINQTNSNINTSNIIKESDLKEDTKNEEKEKKEKKEIKCNKCNLPKTELNTIKNICQKCFIAEIINQSKTLYIEYLKEVIKVEKVNTITKKDFEDLFLKKIVINYDNKQYNIYEAIDEFNYNKGKEFDVNKKLDEIILELKEKICLYCLSETQNNEFKLPCGCNFCTFEHLDLFIKEKIQNKFNYNYKCFCSYEYKSNKMLELFSFFLNKNIYKDYSSLIQNLNELFSGLCFKCGCEKKEKSFVEIEGFIPIRFDHYICGECIEGDNTNYVECSICKIQHKYFLNDF